MAGQFFTNILIPVGLLLLVYLAATRLGGADNNDPLGMQGRMNMGKSKVKVQLEPDTGVNFDAVAGVDEAK